MLTRENWEKARSRNEDFRSSESMVLTREQVTKLADELDEMLGGDPWQEAENAATILGILQP